MNELSDGAGVLEFSGPDAVRFLNGQVTQDVRAVKEGRDVLPSCVTDVKGRLMFRIWLGGRGDGILVFCRAEQKEDLEARLTRYLIADDVEVRDVSGEMNLDDYDFPEEWVDERDRIEKGIPKWGAELKEGMLPQEAGLDATDISYFKGCYVGQEVISRIKSAGKVNRRMVKLVFNGSGQLGEFVNAEGKVCGEVTSVAGEIGLGYLKRSADGEVVFSIQGTEVRLRE